MKVLDREEQELRRTTDPSIVSTTWGACVLNFVSLRALGERGNGRNKQMDEK